MYVYDFYVLYVKHIFCLWLSWLQVQNLKRGVGGKKRSQPASTAAPLPVLVPITGHVGNQNSLIGGVALSRVLWAEEEEEE